MMIKPSELPPEARISLSQQASTHDQGLSLIIRGNGWVPPDFGDVDWSQPITVEPIGPVPGNLASVTGIFRLQLDTDLHNQQVNWSLIRELSDLDDQSVADETTSVSIGLLQSGWAILRAADGSAIPMMAYGKRRVTARGTGNPPINLEALSTATFGGVSILITDFDVDSAQNTWSITGEEQ